MRITRRQSSTSTPTTAASSRDPSPFALYATALPELEEDEENSSDTIIARERSHSVAAVPRSSFSLELSPMHRKRPDLRLSSMDELEEIDELNELGTPSASGTSSEMDSAPQSMSSVQSSGSAQPLPSPKKVERKLRSRDESVSVPKLSLAHSSSAAESLNPRQKITSPVALSARSHRRRLSSSDKSTSLFPELYNIGR